MSGQPRKTEFIDAEQDRRLRRFGIRAWAWIGILLLAAMLYMGVTAFSGFVIPFVVAIVLGMVFQPLAGILGRVMPRQLASLLVLIGLGVVAVFAIGVVVVGIIDQGPEIVDQMQIAIDKLREWLTERGIEFGAGADLQQQLTASLDTVVPEVLSYLPSAFSGISTFLASTFIALFILYFILAEWDSLAGWVGAHLGVPADLGKGIVGDATRSFRDYFYVLTLSSIPVAVTVGVAAYVLGIPLAFTIGLITFITSYVPYLGALVSSLFALLIAFGSGGPVVALIILIVILVAQNVVQPVIQRGLERSALDLHPIVSFGSTIIGSGLFGILGATLSAPTVAMVLRVRKRILAFQAGELEANAAASFFDEAAVEWDTPERQQRAHALASIIREHVQLDSSLRVIEIGAGTGLLGMDLANDVQSVLLTDPSDGMLGVAREKIREASVSNVTTVVYDVPGDPPSGAPFDLAISLLALHHVADTAATLRSIKALLAKGGRIALLDLDAEDGSFHDDDLEGIHHKGFDRTEIERLARSVGFAEVSTQIVFEIEREGRPYPLFLLTAQAS